MAARRQQRAIGPAKQHAEWRSLVEVSGPFLSMEVLTKTFPQGLDKPGDEADVRARLKSALEEWQESDRESIHRAFVRLVLREVLGFDDAIMRQGQAIPGALVAEIREHGERVVPDLVVNNPESETPRLLVSVVHWEQRLESPVPKSKWSASPATRMMELLRATDVKLGLVINGEQWMLVHAPRSETSTFASFYASVWLDEPLTLRAFRSLVGARRLFGVDAGESLEALFAESAKHQHEVTDQLGLQVRRAVEVLIQAIDRIDKDRGRKLLAGVDEKRLYESAVTVMMRLVFLLAAEERKLLLLGNPTYEQHYAISTLREQLRAIADKEGEEVLERRHDAWGRLLATFRAVHGGIVHHDLRLPAYGGSLFDPDRYPFLEGRAEGSKWREGPADPLPINNRAVLHLLEAIQLLQIKIGGQTELQRLSFRALDVEQIGHVYEGLLDHTAKRATTPMLGLVGTKGKDSEVAIDDVEPIRRKGNDELVAFFREATGKSESAVLKGIAYPMRKEEEAQLLAVCDNQRPLYNRVAPYAGLLREDSGGRRVVYDVGSVYVTDGTDRRSSGTHYTPKSLTEPIVQYTLEPLVYVGPAEGTARESWKLKSAKEILALRVCDLAMGSGAFLVQACRYLAARLVEAWGDAERSSGGKLVVTPEGALSTGDPSERPMPRDPDERMLLAMRAVADRCLYGVDRNPMAVEMGKLSLWLSTLQRDRPFTFVDHALRCGDSLLGVIDISQLERFHVLPTHGGTMPLGVEAIRPAIRRAIELRQEIEHRVTETLEDANAKARLLVEANSTTTDMGLVADLLVGAALTTTSKGSVALDDELLDLAEPVRALLSRSIADVARDALRVTLRQRASKLLNNGRDPSQGERRPFHWAIEFPEVFATPRSGFDALVGNPPFKGGAGIATLAGDDYRDLLVSLVAGGRTGRRGQADLAAYFVLRAASLLRVDGQTGLVLVNSVVQGDSRVVAFTHLLTCGYVIVRAVSSSPWPGSAAIEIVVVWMRRGTSSAQRFLDDRPVAFIDSGLEGGAEATTVVRPLAANMGRVFRGAMPYGEGFLLAREDAETLVAREPAARAVVLRYLDGDDVNNRPDQRATRYAIFFGQLSLSEVRARFPEALKIVETRVKPQREALEDNNSTARHRREVWWQFSNTAGALTRALGTSAFALVISRVTAHHFFARVGTDQVFSERLMVCCADDYGFYAVLNSSIHAAWAHRPGSTTHESRLTYLGESYETFALPSLTAALKRIGEDHDHVRGAVGMNRGEGLTRIYNRFHEPNDCAQDLAQLREIQVEMDRAVAIAYGWDGVSLAHGFHHTKQGVRFTISEAARRDILNRLLEVNHHRYEDELKEGLHDKSKKLGRARAAPMDDPSGAPSKPQLSLFGAATATPERGTSETDPNKVLRVLQRAQAPLGKSEILVQAKVADAEWGAAIAALKDAGLVVQEGEKRGARYRAVT